MTIKKTKQDDALTLALEGRLDTTTAPDLEAELNKSLDDIKTLVLDLDGLKYISSAGLRVVLGAQKRMTKQGQMIIKNVNEVVMEVFEVTGFVDILTIEK